MDTVILAAGRNQRLQHIIPPYHKPFIVLNGRSVLERAVDVATQTHPGDRCIVVCAPQNAVQAAHVVNSRALLAVQAMPRGPGDALWCGLQLVVTEHVLVLMGDNVTDVGDVRLFQPTSDATERIGIQRTRDLERAASFTVWNHKSRRWEEKVPIGPEHIKPAIDIYGDDTRLVTCWFGPLMLRTARALDVLTTTRVVDDGTVRPELLIGPILSELAPNGIHVPVHTSDVDTEVLR